MVSSNSGPFHCLSSPWFSGQSSLMLCLNLSAFLFGFPLFFLMIFLHRCQEAILALCMFNMLDRYINSLGKNLVLNLCVYNNATSMWSNVDSSSFALGTFVGHSFLNRALDVNDIAFLVDLHACGLRSSSMFSNETREHWVGTFPLSLHVGRFCKLLEVSGFQISTIILILKEKTEV